MTNYYKSYGFLSVTRGYHGKRSEKFYTVSYGGNMWNTMQHVADAFEALYGAGTFEPTVAAAKKVAGSPDYTWYAEVPAAEFEALVTL